MIARWTQRYPRWTWLAAVAILLALDQVTKTYFSTTLSLGQGIAVTEWFNLVHVLNTGAAFSFLADAGGWQRGFFIGVSVLVVGVVVVICLGQKAGPLDRWVGAFVAGGGGGNLVDRIQTGAVVDFIDLHWRGIHWPAFNLADVFIVCAMLVWIFMSLKSSPGEPAAQTQAELPPMKKGWFWLMNAWGVALVATLGALFVGEVMGMMPCLLCWYQRIFMFPLALILGMAAFAEDRRGALYALPLALGGTGMASYHTALVAGWVPKWWVPCGSGPSCGEQSLEILGGIQIPWLSLLAFFAISILLIVYLRKIRS